MAGAPALADARVENGSFLARVGADDQERIGLLDPGNGRIEDPGRPSRLGVKGVAALHGQIGRTVLAEQILEREHLLDRGEIAGDGPDPLAVAHPDLGRYRRKSFLPRRGAKLAVVADIGPVEPLRAQAVDDVAGLVGNPFLVDRLVDARQDPHHFAAAGIDPDRGAYAVHHVDRLGLAELPGPRGKGVRL